MNNGYETQMAKKLTVRYDDRVLSLRPGPGLASEILRTYGYSPDDYYLGHIDSADPVSEGMEDVPSFSELATFRRST